ncbi:A/G-specific adenine glycosylase, variant [Spizellomyces punctatus DAOM BR117]|nr:A/G-specific adenine glycosylase, variant [Spizellomyces punctatus DAOM BR117]KNC97067.1 A/G-specific adenine glycosylase, variant [Spizellomyces punctatus DAOM BR117]|eukprot:XP_016605107.1 A/G-specific adenine glycosylase, variant [Spizellomyces punctatus DAOM BR117]
MLQQTQVATVIPYYKRWLQNWPTIHDLAKAHPEDVNKVWSGLGYYSRARRLHEGSQLVVRKFEGILPRDAKSLEKEVPGIGPYTAGAIASIAYNLPAPLVDGNVVRVLSRLRAVAGDPKGKDVISLHWSLAKDILDPDRPGHFNQALMDLGATVCTPQTPDCVACPIKEFCRANAEQRAQILLAKQKFLGTGNVDSPAMSTLDLCKLCPPLMDIEESGVKRYPAKAKKKPPREEVRAVCILEHVGAHKESKFLLVQGPKEGLLANLWDFPNIELQLPEPSTDGTGGALQSKSGSVIENIQYGTWKTAIDEWMGTHLNISLSSLQDENRTRAEVTVIDRMDLGSTLHLFSHIKRVMVVEHVIITGEIQLPSNVTAKTSTSPETLIKGKSKPRNAKEKTADTGVETRPLRWFTEAEMMGDSAAVPATLKKAFALLVKARNATMKTRKAPGNAQRKKRKAVDEDVEDDAGDVIQPEQSTPLAKRTQSSSSRTTKVVRAKQSRKGDVRDAGSQLKQSGIAAYLTRQP